MNQERSGHEEKQKSQGNEGRASAPASAPSYSLGGPRKNQRGFPKEVEQSNQKKQGARRMPGEERACGKKLET